MSGHVCLANSKNVTRETFCTKVNVVLYVKPEEQQNILAENKRKKKLFLLLAIC